METLLLRSFILLSIAAVCRGQTNRSPPCHLKDVDICLSFVIGFTDEKAGANREAVQYERQCTSLRRTDSCLQNYTQHCMTPVQRSLFNSGLSGARRVGQEYCSPDSDLRQTYRQHVPCLRSVIKDPRSACMKDLNLMGEVVTETQWNKRIDYACCAYHRVGACLRREITKSCGEDTMTFVRTFVKKLASRLPEIRCRDLTENSATCRQLPPFGTSPRGGKSSSVITKLIRTYTTQ